MLSRTSWMSSKGRGTVHILKYKRLKVLNSVVFKNAISIKAKTDLRKQDENENRFQNCPILTSVHPKTKIKSRQIKTAVSGFENFPRKIPCICVF